MRLDFTRSGELAEAARECEAEVFLKHYGNTRELLDDEFGPYLQDTGFVVVSRVDGDVLAVARLILPGESGSKTLHDITRPPWQVDADESVRLAGIDRARTVDVASMGVRRGSALLSGTAAVLVHGITLVYRANDLLFMTATVDTRVRAIQHAGGRRYHLLPLTWAAPFLGSPATVPVYAHLPEQLDEQRRLAPDDYRLVTLGIGLGEVTVPGVSAFRWPPPA